MLLRICNTAKWKTVTTALSEAAYRHKQETQAAQLTARELGAELFKEAALVQELKFQIQDAGGQQLKASVYRVSAFLANPANDFAVLQPKKRKVISKLIRVEAENFRATGITLSCPDRVSLGKIVCIVSV